MKTEDILERMETHRKAIGEERDRLASLIDDLEGLKDSCDRAYLALEEARDALSELA